MASTSTDNKSSSNVAAAPTDTKPTYMVPKGSLLELVLQMKQDMEGIQPFPTTFTRTDYLINMCFDAMGARGAEALMKDLAPRPPMEWPWFLIDQERLTLQHYARFVYTFVNMVYNPTSKLQVSVDGGTLDESTIVPATHFYMANCFNWMHAHSDKLTRLLRDIDPEWDTNANTSIRSVVNKVAAERITYDIYLNKNVEEHVKKNMSSKANAKDLELAKRVRTSAVIASILPLVHADSKTLKTEAKRAGISKFGMLMLSLEFDDVARQYSRMSSKDKKELYDKRIAEEKKNATDDNMPALDDSQ